MNAISAWWLLVLSGLLDVVWAVSTKYADGYTRPGWSLLSLASLAGFVWLLGRALQALPLGTAYAVWTGIGAVGSVLLGAGLFGETLTPLRVGLILLVLGGIVGLKLTA
jgi:quaternary ammonium compound-resistance protein SugE